MRTGVYIHIYIIYLRTWTLLRNCMRFKWTATFCHGQHLSKLQDPNIPRNFNHHASFHLSDRTMVPKDTVGSLSCLRRLRRNPASLRVVLPVQRSRQPFTTSLPIRLWLSYAEIWGIIYESYNLWHEPRCFLQKVCWQKSFFGKAGAGSNHPGNSNCCMDAQIQ